MKLKYNWTIVASGSSVNITDAANGIYYALPASRMLVTELGAGYVRINIVGENFIQDIYFEDVVSPVSIDSADLVTNINTEITTASGGGGGGGSVVYAGNSPSTTTVNGIPSGTVLTGMTFEELLENIYAPFQAPTFSSFSISGQSQTIEVGTALSGSKLFTWNTTNSGNIQANSLQIRDVTSNTLIASSLVNDGTESVSIGTITNTSPISRNWRIEATNTQSNSFQSSNFNVSSIYPYFYGKVASGGAAPGVNRPIADQALIDSGTVVVANSNGTITITYSSTSDDYIWFAIPTANTQKTIWYIDGLNNGSIGGSVSPSGNLFPTFDTVSIDSPSVLWNGISYNIYIANYQSAITNPIQLRNS